MKFAGKSITGPNVVEEFIPRGTSDGFLIRAQAVLDYTEFDQLCPVPAPPVITRPGGATSTDPTDPKFRAKIADYSQKKLAWLIITSLKATAEITWESVQAGNPDTWAQWDVELQQAGFSVPERNRILGAVMKANCMDESFLEKARADFLLRQASILAASTSQQAAQ